MAACANGVSIRKLDRRDAQHALVVWLPFLGELHLVLVPVAAATLHRDAQRGVRVGLALGDGT